MKNSRDQFKYLIYERKDHIGSVTLNHPGSLNIYDARLGEDLEKVLGTIKEDPEVRVVICTGGDKAFCAGADLRGFASTAVHRNLLDLFRDVPQPIIAAVQGYVLGPGIEILLGCDIRVAACDAKFGLPGAWLGTVPQWQGLGMPPDATIQVKILDRHWLSAEEACHSGLVNRVVSKQRLLEVVEELAGKIASYDTVAVRAGKRAVVDGLGLPLVAGLELERRLAGRSGC
jgi:enoyl-CoA hydratase/carnithine racemase